MFTLLAMLALVTAALFAVGHQAAPAQERSGTHGVRGVLRTAVRGNAILAAGPAWQYDKIAGS